MNRIAAEYLYTGTRPEPLRNGYVEYTEDGTIVSAGVCRDPASEQDFRKGALMPGFVNSHCHLELSHLKGKFRKGTGMSGVHKPDKRTQGLHFRRKQDGRGRQVARYPVETGSLGNG